MAMREFVLRIVGDTTQATRSLDNLGRDVSSFQQGFRRIGSTLGVALGTAAVVDFGKSIVNAASDQEQAIGAAQSVFGEYAADIQKFGSSAAENVGVSVAQFNQLSAVTGSLLKNAGVPMDEVTDSTIALTERASDLAAMFGGDVSQAMDAINSGLKGELDPLEKFGVSLKASAVDARAAALGYVDAEGKVTEYGKQMARIELIMEQSADAQGTFARESDTVAGQTQILKAQFADLQADLGKKLLPVIVEIAEVLSGLLRFVQRNQGWLLPLVAGIAGFVAAIKTATIAQAAWNAVTAANPIVLIIAGIAALVAGFVLLYQKVGWFRDAVDSIVDVFQNVFGWVQDNWPLLLAIITGPIGIAVKIIVDHWDTIKAAVMGVFNWVKNNWPTLLAILTGPFGLAVLAITRNWDSIISFFRGLPARIGGLLSAIWSTISQPFVTAKNRVVETMEAIALWFQRLPGRIGSFFSGVASVIRAPFESAFNAIKRLWNATVGGFGFSVPSWVPGVGGKSFRIPEMAQGGIVTGPTIALLGEAGREAVVPLDKGGMGIGNTVYNVNVYALNPTWETGRLIADSLREYDRTSGRG